MRKTAAFLICLSTVLWMGLLVLHPSIQQLVLWLSPSLGAELYTSAAVLFLLAADPLAYAAVAALWLAVAFLGGLIVRRHVGAVLTMLTVWLTLVPVLAVSLFGVAMNVQAVIEDTEGVGPISLIPPIPPGMTLAGLLDTPVVGEKVTQLLSGGVENLTQEQAMGMLWEAAYGMGLAVLLRPLLILVGALLGVEVGRVLEKRVHVLPRRSLPSISQGAFIVLALLVASVPAPSAAQPIDTSDGIYVENLLGVADTQGRVVLLDAFAATSGEGVGQGNQVAHLIVVHSVNLDPFLANVSLPEGLDAGSFINLVPGALLVTVYVDTPPGEARSLADEANQATAEALGITVHSLGAFEAPEMEYSGVALPPLTVAIGFSDGGLEELAPILLKEFTGRGGLAQVVAKALGALIPGASEDAPETTVLMVGELTLGPLLDMMSLPSYPVELEEPMNMIREETLQVALGAHVWDMGVEPVGEGFKLDLGELLDHPSVSLSQYSDLSFITLVTPNNTVAGDLTPNIHVCTNQPEDSYVLSLYVHLLSEMGVIEVTSDLDPGAEALQAHTSLPLAPRVVLEKTMEESAAVGRALTVTVTATNPGTQAVENLMITDDPLSGAYSRSVEVEGEVVKSLATLGPGQSTSITYTVEPQNPGTYSFRPATATYVFGDQSYYSVSGRVSLSTGPPGVLTVAKTLRRDTVMLLDLLTNGGGEAATNASIAGAVLLIALNLALSLRRLTAKAQPPPAEQPSPQQPP